MFIFFPPLSVFWDLQIYTELELWITQDCKCGCLFVQDLMKTFFFCPHSVSSRVFVLYVDDTALLVACTRGNDTVKSFATAKIHYYNNVTVASSALIQQWDGGLHLPRDRHGSGSSYFQPTSAIVYAPWRHKKRSSRDATVELFGAYSAFDDAYCPHPISRALKELYVSAQGVTPIFPCGVIVLSCKVPPLLTSELAYAT